MSSEHKSLAIIMSTLAFMISIGFISIACIEVKKAECVQMSQE